MKEQKIRTSILWAFLVIFIAICITLTMIFNAIRIPCKKFTQAMDQDIMCLVDTGTKIKDYMPRKFEDTP